MNGKLKLSVVAFGLFCASIGLQHALIGQYHYVDDIGLVDPVQHAHALYDKGAYKDAQDYIDFYRSLPGVSHEESARLDPLQAQIQQKRESLGYQLKEVSQGFFLGKSSENYGKAAEVASALIGVSDVRDLIEAGENWTKGEAVDPFTTALAAIGLTLTAAAIGPQAPAAVSAKTAAALLKIAGKAGKLSASFRRSVIEIVTETASRRSPELLSARLLTPLSHLSSYAKRSGIDNALEVLAHTDDVVDIPRVIHVADSFGDQAKGMLKFGGKEIVAITEKRGAHAVLAVSKYGEGAVQSLKHVSAKTLLHDIKRWTAILASPFLKMLDLFLWLSEGVLAILWGITAWAGMRLWRRRKH